MLDKLATAEIKREADRTQHELGADTTTRIGVHVLSQFLYCPRAGIVAFESKPQDDGIDFCAAPALGGLPTHDLDKIRRGIEEVDARIRKPIHWTLALFLLFSVLALFNWELAVGPGIGSLVWLFQALQLIRFRFVLSKRLRAALCAARAEPDWSHNEIQPVNWWQLLQAGFVSREKHEPLVDTTLGIAGKPWRVLHRDVWQIPVIQIRVEPDRKKQKLNGLSLQQYARIAAYSYLIFQTERLIAPWAIVLFGKGHEGIAVPIRSESWDAFRKGLSIARRHVSRLVRDKVYEPHPPKNEIACQRCPFGQPQRPRRANVLNGQPFSPFITTSRTNVAYHSTCGDRFRWVPPHEEAKELGLTDR